MPIVLYDIPSTVPNMPWSPNTWRTRIALNYKGLAYRTEWLEYPDIEPTLRSLGIGPTRTKKDGSPFWTLPAILDLDEAGVVKAKVAESFVIAKYLDQAYPDTPRLFPADDAALEAQRMFAETFLCPMLTAPASILLKDTTPILNVASQDHFERYRNLVFDGPHGADRVEDIPSTQEHRAELWALGREAMNKLDAESKELEKERKGEGGWYGGDVFSFADCVIGGFMAWARCVLGEESAEWKILEEWNGGRLRRWSQGLDLYRTVV